MEFMDDVQGSIIPFLNPFPQPSSVLVLDNCGIHHTYEEDHLRDMVEARGAILLFLAPYSPIDNPIETSFNVFKACWKRNQIILNSLEDQHEAIRWCFENCYKDPALSAQKSFARCGYK